MLDRNVRGIGIALCLLTLFIFLSGCGSLKDDTLLTVNAVITEVDTGKQTITVKDDADENTLGEECLIDCSSTPMVYCDFATQKVTRISFEELQVNDKVIMCIRSSEIESFRSSGNVSCENADDEGDKLHHFFAVYGAKNNGEKGDKSANECNIRACGRYLSHLINNSTVFNNLFYRVCHNLALCKVGNSIAGKRKTYDRNCRTDDNCRHKLVNPFYAGNLYGNGNYNINKACEECT